MQKKRIDILLVEKSLAKSRSQAQQHIQNGLVSVNKKVIKKPSECFYENDEIEIQSTFCWVSRGALKLLHAFEQWNITAENLVCLDIGASTGGFTQVLLEKKAKKVYAIDAGHSQMDKLLKQDSRVVCKEKCNARDMNFDVTGEIVDIIVIDVSFISLTKIIENLLQFTKKETQIKAFSIFFT